MFDLLGFWGNVTVITGLLLIPFIFIAALLAEHLTKSITGDGDIAKTVRKKILDGEVRSDGSYKSYSDYVKFFGMFTIREEVMFFLSLFSIILWIISLLKSSIHSTTIVSIISGISESLSSFTGEVFLFVIIYILIIKIGRHIYKMYLKAEKVLRKLDETS